MHIQTSTYMRARTHTCMHACTCLSMRHVCLYTCHEHVQVPEHTSMHDFHTFLLTCLPTHLHAHHHTCLCGCNACVLSRNASKPTLKHVHMPCRCAKPDGCSEGKDHCCQKSVVHCEQTQQRPCQNFRPQVARFDVFPRPMRFGSTRVEQEPLPVTLHNPATSTPAVGTPAHIHGFLSSESMEAAWRRRTVGTPALPYTRAGVAVDMRQVSVQFELHNAFTVELWLQTRAGQAQHGWAFDFTAGGNNASGLSLFLEPTYLVLYHGHCSFEVHLYEEFDDNRYTFKSSYMRQIVITRNTNSIALYLDGVLMHRGRCVAGAQAPFVGWLGGMNASVGHLDIDIAMFVMYNVSLSAVEIQQLHDGNSEHRSCLTTSDLYITDDNPVFRDANGHSCLWYQMHLHKTPGICASDLVQAQCPISCEAKRKCYTLGQLTAHASNAVGPPDNAQEHKLQVWNRVMNIESSLGHSSLCLSRDINIKPIIKQCSKWNEKTREAYAELYLTCVQQNATAKTNLSGYALLTIDSAHKCSKGFNTLHELYEHVKQSTGATHYDDLNLRANFDALHLTQGQIPRLSRKPGHMSGKIRSKPHTDLLNCDSLRFMERDHADTCGIVCADRNDTSNLGTTCAQTLPYCEKTENNWQSPTQTNAQACPQTCGKCAASAPGSDPVDIPYTQDSSHQTQITKKAQASCCSNPNFGCGCRFRVAGDQSALLNHYRTTLPHAVSVSFWVRAKPESFKPSNGFYDKVFAPFISILAGFNSTGGFQRLLTIFPANAEWRSLLWWYEHVNVRAYVHLQTLTCVGAGLAPSKTRTATLGVLRICLQSATLCSIRKNGILCTGN